jgi:hypothetical protein
MKRDHQESLLSMTRQSSTSFPTPSLWTPSSINSMYHLPRQSVLQYFHYSHMFSRPYIFDHASSFLHMHIYVALCLEADATTAAAFLLNSFRKPKRNRTAFTPAQLLKLEDAFERNHYIVGDERKALARHLNLSETKVCSRCDEYVCRRLTTNLYFSSR